MRTIIGIASIAFVGFLAWHIVGRLSDDAIGMGVGMVFGVLAGIPAALLVFATGGRRTDDGAYEAGYRAGIRDTTDLARGLARQLPEHGATQRPAVIIVQPPMDDDDDDIDSGIEPYYTPAYPFGRQRQFRVVGEVE